MRPLGATCRFIWHLRPPPGKTIATRARPSKRIFRKPRAPPGAVCMCHAGPSHNSERKQRPRTVHGQYIRTPCRLQGNADAPPAPNINVELGMGGDLGVRILLSTQAPWIATSPNINEGVRGGILRRKVRIYCPCTVLLDRARDLQEDWRHKLKEIWKEG